ncbi:hypothetical protein CFter6_2880 [Collimonas fungivorans]|uniref:Uncharacterized protein n=1 Tax=Collimonas fungivorans TaxID=158899 RepID=A0A127PCJ5_9BURK|nr:hypothetical protein CFter6_2880 [Collimonas fungivorans]
MHTHLGKKINMRSQIFLTGLQKYQSPKASKSNRYSLSYKIVDGL